MFNLHMLKGTLQFLFYFILLEIGCLQLAYQSRKQQLLILR